MCLEIMAHLVIISERRLLGGGQGFLGAGQGISVCTVFRGRSGCILALWPAPFFSANILWSHEDLLLRVSYFLKSCHTRVFVGVTQFHGMEKLAVIPDVAACGSRLSSPTNTSAGNSTPVLL